jgi:hypothetical protein
MRTAEGDTIQEIYDKIVAGLKEEVGEKFKVIDFSVFSDATFMSGMKEDENKQRASGNLPPKPTGTGAYIDPDKIANTEETRQSLLKTVAILNIKLLARGKFMGKKLTVKKYKKILKTIDSQLDKL